VGNLVKEFKAFILRGNVVDLAVAFVLGVAFAAVINALVAALISPLIALILGGQESLTTLVFHLGDTAFPYGMFLDALVTFIAIGLVIFLAVVKPMNMLLARRKTEATPTTKQCPECLSEIPLDARRCASCGVPQAV
jgi:large conductance mechanosensitive channel